MDNRKSKSSASHGQWTGRRETVLSNVRRCFCLWAVLAIACPFCQVALAIRQPVIMPAEGYAAWTSAASKGETWTAADGSVMTYARPDEYTLLDGSPHFNVMVAGESYTGLYCCNNPWGGRVSFGYFDFDDEKPVEVVISCRKELGDFELLPENAAITDVEKLTDKILRFRVTRSNQNITLVTGSDYRKDDVLHLFCNDIITPPAVADPEGYHYDRDTKTYYFGPGYYDLNELTANGQVAAVGGRSIYVSGGAVVYGSLGFAGNDSRIYGHGIVVTSHDSQRQLSCQSSDGGSIEGVIFHRFKARGWQTTYTYCKNLTVSNVKIIAMQGGSSDGIDLTGCDGITFDNCFVRAYDDCVAIKGLAAEGTLPANSPAQRNLTFRRMQLWTDTNNAFGIGAETRASVFENIRFEDSDILFAYDEKSITEGMADRSAINICALHGTFFRNIHYDNIRINSCTRLFAMGFEDSFWYGSIVGDQSTEGDISDVYFSNITVKRDTGTPVSNDIWLYGWQQQGTPTKYIHDIYFDNVTICGQPLKGWDYQRLKTNNTTECQLVYDLHFNERSGIGSPTTSNGHSRMYNLQGQRVGDDYRGITIANGKKVMK